MNYDDEKKISEIYNARLQQSLPDYKIVGWGSKKSQHLRFKVLTEINQLKGASILDVGCGLGELCNFFEKNDFKIESYKGIDISEDCISEAQNRLGIKNNTSFDYRNILQIEGEGIYDYVFLSGALNLKMEDNISSTKQVIKKMYSLCKKGVACNFLSSYVDYSIEKDFHYSPEEIFSFAKKLSNKVVLRHDYPLYEFTIYIYKDE